MNAAVLRWTVAGACATTLALALLIIAVRSAAQPAALEVRYADPPVADGVVKVWVTGAVASPGIYELRPGERHADAVAAAGGTLPDADPEGVNLARRVRDEERIHVPFAGEVAAGGASGTAAIDLNRASVTELETLPGIGQTRAQQIVTSRTRDGRFQTPEDLVTRKLLPASLLETLREQVTVQ